MTDVNAKLEQLFNSFYSTNATAAADGWAPPTRAVASNDATVPTKAAPPFYLPSLSSTPMSNNNLPDSSDVKDVFNRLPIKKQEPEQVTTDHSNLTSVYDARCSSFISGQSNNNSNNLLQSLFSNSHNATMQFAGIPSTTASWPSINTVMTPSHATSSAIPISGTAPPPLPPPPPSNDMSQCLKAFLEEQQIRYAFAGQNSGGEQLSSSLSSNSDTMSNGGGHHGGSGSPPGNLVDSITHETVTYEHKEDFIKSLQIPLEVLDDLASRFLLNVPEEEKNDLIRIFFQMENAYWHYLDFSCEYETKLPKFKFKRFAQIMFTYLPRLRPFLDSFDENVNRWVQYKFSIPCSGAIMLDESLENLLLVQGYGSKTWGFPKGKVNHDESLINCAIREVQEETGYDCVSNIFESQYLERKIFESRLRLYLVKDVETDFDFKPHARKEIRDIKWFALKDLPQHVPRRNANGANGNSLQQQQLNASKFISVMPFVNAIRKWVELEKRKRKKQMRRERRLATKKLPGGESLDQETVGTTRDTVISAMPVVTSPQQQDHGQDERVQNMLKALLNVPSPPRAPQSAVLQSLFSSPIPTPSKQPPPSYNGLDRETLQMVHPKIELLLQRLKTVNMA